MFGTKFGHTTMLCLLLSVALDRVAHLWQKLQILMNLPNFGHSKEGSVEACLWRAGVQPLGTQLGRHHPVLEHSRVQDCTGDGKDGAGMSQRGSWGDTCPVPQPGTSNHWALPGLAAAPRTLDQLSSHSGASAGLVSWAQTLIFQRLNSEMTFTE